MESFRGVIRREKRRMPGSDSVVLLVKYRICTGDGRPPFPRADPPFPVVFPVIPIYVISLATGADRRARMRAQFDRLGLPFQFIDGVDGRAMTEQEREQAAPARLRRYWSHLTG